MAVTTERVDSTAALVASAASLASEATPRSVLPRFTEMTIATTPVMSVAVATIRIAHVTHPEYAHYMSINGLIEGSRQAASGRRKFDECLRPRWTPSSPSRKTKPGVRC